MVDFHGDMADENINIKTYEIREDSKYYFNPLELHPAFSDITPLRATSDFIDAISINFPTLGIQQRDRLKKIIKTAYEETGITKEKEIWSKELKFDYVECEIKNSDDKTTESIMPYIRDIFDYKLFAGEEKLSMKSILQDGIKHINLKALPEGLSSLYADLLLRRLYYSLRALGEIPRGNITNKEKFRLFVIVDEAKLLVKEKQGIKAALNKYATELRKFGVGLILASQLVDHFTNEILANTATKLCMKAENKEQARRNSRFFEVTEKDLTDLPTGEGILIIGSKKMNIKIAPTWEKGL